MIKIRELLIEHNRPGTRLTPTSVTVHNTANPNSTAQNNRDYFSNHPQARASTHYVVDDQEVIRCIPEDEVSWHAGRLANHSSLSIEVCEFTDAVRQQRCNERAARLLADILSRYDWGLEQIRTHKYWTGKQCPRKLLPIWDQFLAMVQARLDESLEQGTTPTPLAAALDILQAHGLLNSPDYWLQHARQGETVNGAFAELLILRMADLLTKGGDRIAG